MEQPTQRRLDPYEELGVAKNASQEAIKKAYRRRSSKSHPDRGGSHEDMQRINRAYALIGHPEARSRYDSGEGEAPKHTPEAQAQTILATLWSQVIERFSGQDPPDLLKHVEEAINSGMSKAEAEIAKDRKILRKMEKIKKYLKPNKQSIGTLEHVLGEKISVIERKIKANEEMKDLGPLVLEMLHMYGWEGPPPSVEPAGISSWVFSSQ